MKSIIMDGGLTEKMASGFLKEFKPGYESFQFTYEFSFSAAVRDVAAIENDLLNFQSALQQHTTKLVFDRFYIELEIHLNTL